MTRTLRSVSDLVAAGLSKADEAASLAEVAARYAIAVTPDMAALIAPGDPEDPIALQFLPSPRELERMPDERDDPIGDHAHSPAKGVVHRYPDRALLKITHTCPVYCRFCFRREMVGPDGDGTLSGDDLDAAIGYLASRPEIFEVILTGGDPFTLSARRIRDVTRRLGALPHVGIIRWHTRVPIVQPRLVTPTLVTALRASGKTVFVAVHANHAREFTGEARAALRRLADAGVALVSQSVLLRGVNDSVAALAELMRAFVASGVKPYYLHHLDAAPGTDRFRVPVAEGLELVRALRGNISGLMQPTYVVDIPGGHGKAQLAEAVLLPDGEVAVTDRRGQTHRVPGGSRRAEF